MYQISKILVARPWIEPRTLAPPRPKPLYNHVPPPLYWHFVNLLLKKSFAPPVLYSRISQHFANLSRKKLVTFEVLYQFLWNLIRWWKRHYQNTKLWMVCIFGQKMSFLNKSNFISQNYQPFTERTVIGLGNILWKFKLYQIIFFRFHRHWKFKIQIRVSGAKLFWGVNTATYACVYRVLDSLVDQSLYFYDSYSSIRVKCTNVRVYSVVSK